MKMTDIELLAIVQAHRADSLGVEDGELSNERAVALDRYHGRPYGNEMEGRSSIVSKDLSEAVDWAMPAIMRIFTQSGKVAEFDPVGPEDEQQAEIETAYVNQVIMRDNAGWLVLHDAIKDTLLLKNGYVKHWWEETEKIEEPEYKGLFIQQVQQLMGDLKQSGAEVEITGQEEHQIETQQGPQLVYDIELKIKRKQGKVRIEAVPSEEIRVSRKCRGTLQDSPFVEHVTCKTRSDLIEMGMDREFVDTLPAYNVTNNSTQAFSRDRVSDESNSRTGTSYNDLAMDEIEYCEAYIRTDWDDDGVAELRKVVTVGNKIPDGEEWNEPIPEVAITGFVAKRVPHRHVGESLYDDMGDLMEIKTTLLRQLFDNIYRTNDNQWAVNERVNLKDFMTSLPGGIKRIEGIDAVEGAFAALNSPSIVGDILPVIDYVDGIKEGRTGITKASSGLDPDLLQNVTKGAYLENQNRASQKAEMIVRLIAETGVKELVLRVHSLLCRYQDQPRIMKMMGKYMTCNPAEWRERTDLTVKVGLGTGNEEDKQNKLMMISQMQRDMLAPLGLIDAKQGFALFSDIAKTMGFDTPDKYALSPDSTEFHKKQANPQPNPQLQLEQMKQQGESQKVQFMAKQDADKHQAEAQMTMQIEQIKNQSTLQIEIEKLKMQGAIEQQKMQMQLEVDRNRQQVEAEQKQAEMVNMAQLAQMKDQMDRDHKNAELNHAMQLEQLRLQNARDIAEMEAGVRVQIAQISAKTAIDNASMAAQTASALEVTRDMKP